MFVNPGAITFGGATVTVALFCLVAQLPLAAAAAPPAPFVRSGPAEWVQDGDTLTVGGGLVAPVGC